MFIALMHTLLYYICRHRWKLLHALRIFVEHVLLKEEQLIAFARRLDMVHTHIYKCLHDQGVIIPFCAFECIRLWRVGM